jgi:hypothetical protein
MKNTIALLSITSALLFLSACKDSETSYTQYSEQMKDSIFKYYPTVAGITIEVKDRTQLDITLGSADMFSRSDAERSKTANELGMMALRLYPKDNSFEKAQLIVSKDEKSEHVNIAESKISNINLDSLRKVTGK